MPRIAYAAVLILCLACAKKESTADTASSAQPTPAPPKEMTVVFTDDFSSNSSGWSRTLPGEPISIDYRDGQYVLALTDKAAPFSVASGLAPTEFDDVSVEVDAKVIKGDRGSIGVICRASNAGYYFADISGATARIGMYAKEQEILSETNAPDVLKPEEANKFRFDCIGDQLELSVNGNQVLAGADSRLPIGKIGVLAGGAKEGQMEVAFDNLVVKKPQ